MEGILKAFIALFVIMDPIGNISILMLLTKGMPIKEIKKNIYNSIILAGILLFIFLFFGVKIFEFFNISLNSLQIAGGIILLIISIFYVLGRPLKHIKSEGNDLSVPIGTPLLTGPGVITTTMILVKSEGTFTTFIAVCLTLVATFLILINSINIYKILGSHWINVISRVMGIILASIAVEFILKGIVNSISAQF